MRRSGILCVQVNDVRLEASWRYCLKKLEQSYVRAINSGVEYCDFECYCYRTMRRAA